MRTRLPRLLIVLMCVGVLLFQAAVSAGAIRFCRCHHTGGHCCCSVARAAARPACCCSHHAAAHRAEATSTCCGGEQSPKQGCQCSIRSDDTPVSGPSRARVAQVNAPLVAWLELPSAPLAAPAAPCVEPPAIWPPGVRLQSLFCVWLI